MIEPQKDDWGVETIGSCNVLEAPYTTCNRTQQLGQELPELTFSTTAESKNDNNVTDDNGDACTMQNRVLSSNLGYQGEYKRSYGGKEKRVSFGKKDEQNASTGTTTSAATSRHTGMSRQNYARADKTTCQGKYIGQCTDPHKFAKTYNKRAQRSDLNFPKESRARTNAAATRPAASMKPQTPRPPIQIPAEEPK